jgi:hypothetical protein
MSAGLDGAVYTLLTPVREVIDRHSKGGGGECRCCKVAWPCFEVGTAIAALDLVLRVHVAARRQPDSARDSSHTTAARRLLSPST